MSRSKVWVVGTNNLCYEGLRQVLCSLPEVKYVELIPSLCVTNLANELINIIIVMNCNTRTAEINIMLDAVKDISDVFIIIIADAFCNSSRLSDNISILSCDTNNICDAVSAFSHRIQFFDERFDKPNPSNDLYLTSRQKDIVELIIQGLSNIDIAAKLYISTSTVKTHLQHIFERYGVHNRTQLALSVNEKRYSAQLLFHC